MLAFTRAVGCKAGMVACADGHVRMRVRMCMRTRDSAVVCVCVCTCTTPFTGARALQRISSSCIIHKQQYRCPRSTPTCAQAVCHTPAAADIANTGAAAGTWRWPLSISQRVPAPKHKTCLMLLWTKERGVCACVRVFCVYRVSGTQFSC